MKKQIFIPTESGSDWQRLLAKPDLHWKVGRSAMAAAASWEANAPALSQDIVGVLDAANDPALTELELLAAIPEWEVALPGGTRNSQTDIMAFTRNDRGLVILAVEAKVDEPFGPTVGEKRKGASKGQQERLAYLEKELGCDKPMDDSIRYQLLHRTVSALLTARSFHASVAVMLVQSFSPESRWREDFDAFAATVSSSQLTPDLYELPSGDGIRLLIGWCRGDEAYLSVELPGAIR
jgi:hypothetical protein